MYRMIISLVAVGAVSFTGSEAFAECPSCSSVKAIQTAVSGAKGLGATGDVLSVKKVTSEHGMAGGTYEVLIKNARDTECLTEVKVTRYSEPNDPLGASHFKAEAVSSTCP